MASFYGFIRKLRIQSFDSDTSGEPSERPQPRRRATPYEALVMREMILRDHLALERTALANERTLLSYGRTALAMIISGASGMHFLDGMAFQLGGGTLIASGLAVLGIGVRQHRAYRGRIEYIRDRGAHAVTAGNRKEGTVESASADGR
jgi:putative membrane protein